jgi:hypothetical protein
VSEKNFDASEAMRFATSYDKLAETFGGFVHLVAIRLWLSHFVNMV